MINKNGLSGLFFIIVTIFFIYKKCAKSIIITTLLLSLTTLLYHSSHKQISKNDAIIDRTTCYKYLIHRLDTILANFIIIHLLVFDKLPINIQISLSILCAYNNYFRFGILLFFIIIFYKKLDVITLFLVILSLIIFFSKNQKKWNFYQRIQWHLLTSLILLNNSNNFIINDI